MARIDLENVEHTYEPEADEPTYALNRFSITWDDGGRYAILGPSGCGKTTMLNIMSGIIRPSAGRIRFDGGDVTDQDTSTRNIAQVFQFPVIYNTMTVRENLAFPLVCRRVAQDKIHRRVQEVAATLNLDGLLARPANRLTADQKQMISLGRGLVRDDVAAVLMDEPLTVVDPDLKFRLRRKLKEINERYDSTLIYVTHDQNEAMTFAQEIVVMDHGRVVQQGTPKELFERPQTTFVAYFIGSPAMNILPCRLDGGAVAIEGTAVRLAAPGAAEAEQGRKLEIGVRPEFLELAEAPAADAVEVAVADVRDLGNFKVVTVRLADHELKVKVPAARPVPAEKGFLRFPPEWTMLYADGELLA